MHKDEVREAVAAELDNRAEAANKVALEKEVENLKADNATASENAERAAKKAERAEDALKVSEAILEKITAELDEAIAGLGDNPPAEIAKIDEAESGEEAFTAKIAWLAQTAKASTDEALKSEIEELKSKVEAYEAEKAEAEKAARTEARKGDVQEILGEEAEEEEVDTVLAGLVDLDDEEYQNRLESLKIVAGKGRPTVDKDGGAGSAEEEGASGESKVKSAPREDRKINVAASLENAEVETAGTPDGGDEEVPSPFEGLAEACLNKNKNKENKE